MFRDRADGRDDEIKFVRRPVAGRLKTVIGSVAITHANAVGARAFVGDLIYQGDRIEAGIDSRAIISFVDGSAFQLDASTHMVVEKFPGGEERTSHAALFRIVSGTFRFVTGAIATARTIIDTPFGSIRSTGRVGGFGSLAFSALTLGLIHELKAASADFALLDDETIAYKELKHGVFVIVTKEPNPRTIVVDDPGVSFVLRRDGTVVSVQSVANSPAQMAQLQGVYEGVAATLAQGMQDPFIQQLQQGIGPSQHANAQPQSAPGSYGSSTSPSQLNISPQLLQENSGVQSASAAQNGGPISLIVTDTAPVSTSASSQPSQSQAALSPDFGPLLLASTNPTTIVWVSPSGGNWAVGTDWSSNSAPPPQDFVEITVPVTVTINQSETIAGLTVGPGAELIISVGGSLVVANAINNAGVIELNDPTLSISGPVTLSGGGLIEMLGPTASNLIIGVPGTNAALVNADNTIAGSGMIGQGDGDLTLQNNAAGIINANLSGEQIIINTGNAVTNAGLFEATNGGVLTIDDRVANSGTLAANGGVIQVMGEVTGSGAAMISGGGTLELGGTNAQTVTFIGLGTLKLDGSSDFIGNVAGLTTGDIIDLATTVATTAVFNGSTLTVNGTPTSFTISTLPFGDAFFFASDGATGTAFTVETAPTIVINPIEGNNIITGAEAAAGFTINGTASDSGVSVNGQTVTVEILNGSGAVVDSFTGTAQSTGIWSVQVSPTVAEALVKRLLHCNGKPVRRGRQSCHGNRPECDR